VHNYPVEEFSRGVAAGAAALVVSLAAPVVVAKARNAVRRPPAIGLPTAAAALIAIAPTRAPTAGVVIGLAGVATTASLGASLQSRSAARPVVLSVIAAAPFAWLLALDASPIAWVRALVVAGAAVGAVAASRTDASWGPTGLIPVLYAITAFGVFAAVPDTEEAATLLGASAPGALCGWPLGRARLGPAGAAGATALMVWVSAVGGRGRPPSIVGAVACLGLLATLPAGRWLADRWMDRSGCARDPAAPPPVLVLVAHATTVAVASRVAGISSELRVAVPAAAGATTAALAASTWLAGRRWRRSPVRDM
jgi:hypothetical protein